MQFVWWISVLALRAVTVNGRSRGFCPAVGREVDIHIGVSGEKNVTTASSSLKASHHSKAHSGHHDGGTHSNGGEAGKIVAQAPWNQQEDPHHHSASGAASGNLWGASFDPWESPEPMQVLPEHAHEQHKVDSKLTVQVVSKSDSPGKHGHHADQLAQEMSLSPGIEGMQLLPHMPWNANGPLEAFPWQKAPQHQQEAGEHKMEGFETLPSGNLGGDQMPTHAQCLMCKLYELTSGHAGGHSTGTGQGGSSKKIGSIVSDGIKILKAKETDLQAKLASPTLQSGEKCVLLEQLSQVRRLQVEIYKSKLLTGRHASQWGRCDCSKCKGTSHKTATLAHPITTTAPHAAHQAPALASLGAKSDPTAPLTSAGAAGTIPNVAANLTALTPTTGITDGAAHHSTEPTALKSPLPTVPGSGKTIVIHKAIVLCGQGPQRRAQPLAPTATRVVPRDGPTKPLSSVPAPAALPPTPPAPIARSHGTPRSVAAAPSSVPRATITPEQPKPSSTSVSAPLGGGKAKPVGPERASVEALEAMRDRYKEMLKGSGLTVAQKVEFMEMIYKLDTEIERLKTARPSPAGSRHQHHGHHSHASVPKASHAAPASESLKGEGHAATQATKQKNRSDRVARFVNAILDVQRTLEN